MRLRKKERRKKGKREREMEGRQAGRQTTEFRRYNASTGIGKWNKIENQGQARWLTPVIQHFGRPRLVDYEVKRSRPSWSTW